MGEEGADGNEFSDPVTPQMRAIDGLNPFDPCFREARDAGVTTVVTGPGSANVIGGQFAALKTHGRSVEDMLLKDPVAMKAAVGENPKRVYTDKDRTVPRMATPPSSATPCGRRGIRLRGKESVPRAKSPITTRSTRRSARAARELPPKFTRTARRYPDRFAAGARNSTIRVTFTTAREGI